VTGKIIPFETKLQREDSRLAVRKQREEATRRKLLPLVVIVCEVHRVSTEDLLDAQNKHPTVVLARDLVRWLGWSKLHVGTSHLAAALNQSRTGAAQALPRLKKKMLTEAFRRQVECVEKMLDAAIQVKR
jgi:hypothetical protein